MKVSLESPPLLVARVDDARALSGHLRARLRVGERQRDQPRELGQPVLGAGRERLRRRQRCADGAPWTAGDGDRRGYDGLEAELAQLLRRDRGGRLDVHANGTFRVMRHRDRTTEKRDPPAEVVGVDARLAPATYDHDLLSARL